jgi:release factor glutamine methyltransferase
MSTACVRDLTLGALLGWATRMLAPDSPTARLDAEVLLAFNTGAARSSVLAFPDRSVSSRVATRFREDVRRRSAGVPIAYLVGEKEFFSIALKVSPQTLVPRPETELLVEEGLGCIAALSAPRVLDLGTGSGAIALAIKTERSDAEVTGLDVSRAALAVARENGARLGLGVCWLVSDWFSAVPGVERFELIVANPPYVPSRDPALRGPVRFEPRVALDGGADGLDAVRAVLDGAPRYLASSGRLVLEHGHGQRGAVQRLVRERGLTSIVARRDLSGLERCMVVGRQ